MLDYLTLAAFGYIIYRRAIALYNCYILNHRAIVGEYYYNRLCPKLLYKVIDKKDGIVHFVWIYKEKESNYKYTSLENIFFINFKHI